MALTVKMPPKDVQCQCGNILTLEKPSDWCTKCVRKVFYDPKDARKHKINRIYVVTMALVTVFFLIYTFTELVLIPMSHLE